MQKLTVDELGIVVALVIAGVLFLTGGKALLGALLCVAAVCSPSCCGPRFASGSTSRPRRGGPCGDRATRDKRD